MEPINQAERKSAIAKFVFFLVFSVCLLLLPLFFYSLVPTAEVKATEPIMAEDSAEAVDPAEVTELRQRLATLAERMKRVNITLLVDATQGMEKHLPAVAEVANTFKQQYNAEIEAACYRDAAEGAWLYMTNNMVGDDPASWIRALDTESKFDQDEPEALYYGLKRALETNHLGREETNVLILVGDAGNHAQESLTDVPPSDIVQLLEAKDCHFAAFQVRNPTSSSSYAAFSTQIRNELLDPIRDKLGITDTQAKDSLDEYGSYYSFGNPADYLLYSTKPAQTLPADELRKKISTFVGQVLNPIQQYATSVESLAQGERLDLKPGLLEYLQKHQFTSEELELLNDGR